MVKGHRRSLLSLIESYDSNDPDYLEYALTCIKLCRYRRDFNWLLWNNFNDYAQLLQASNAVIEMCQKVGLNFGLAYEDRTLQSIVNQGFLMLLT